MTNCNTIGGMFTLNPNVTYVLVALALSDGQSHFDKAKFYKIGWDSNNNTVIYFYDRNYDFLGDARLDNEGNITSCNEL